MSGVLEYINLAERRMREGGDIAQCMQAVTRPARNRSLFLLFYATILDRFRRKYSFKCSTAAPRGVVIFLGSRVRNSLGPFPSRRPRCKMAGRTQLRKRMAEWRVVRERRSGEEGALLYCVVVVVVVAVPLSYPSPTFYAAP